MTVRRGEIYFVNLNLVQGREQGGQRPVLVISTNAINRQPLVVTVVVGTKGENVRQDYASKCSYPSSREWFTDGNCLSLFSDPSAGSRSISRKACREIVRHRSERIEDAVRYVWHYKTGRVPHCQHLKRHSPRPRQASRAKDKAARPTSPPRSRHGGMQTDAGHRRRPPRCCRRHRRDLEPARIGIPRNRSDQPPLTARRRNLRGIHPAHCQPAGAPRQARRPLDNMDIRRNHADER